MPLFFIKEANYLEILENTTEIIKTTISRKLKNKKTGQEFELNFTKNSSFHRAAWDNTYAEIQKTWAELDSMKKEFKNNNITKEEHDNKSRELNKKLRM
ncbi:hypothetical protein, partial [[Acholeplasma] multilocale]|uniref:hypothetical protein n=1 Tax=[Acholeplasma] multilocale TaxID=264638 RepID=UPI00047E0E7C